ncbi:hypothetical protein SDC9_147728 [bioreactor metagenome]|uniref:Uncharacterized protein n=1 Tax=bioreactor metagenome TaxID=1076179 RepID=A0A645EIX6_9ZZZZ
MQRFRQLAELDQILPVGRILPAVRRPRQRLFRAVVQTRPQSPREQKRPADPRRPQTVELVGVEKNLRLQRRRPPVRAVAVLPDAAGNHLGQRCRRPRLAQKGRGHLRPRQRMIGPAAAGQLFRTRNVVQDRRDPHHFAVGLRVGVAQRLGMFQHP